MANHRLIVDEKKLMKYWDDGLTIQEIADNLNCSTSVIRRILKEHNIDCSRSAMMKRHYSNRNFGWSDVKSDLDNGLSVQGVVKKYNTSYDFINKMISDNNYKTPSRKDMSIRSDVYKNELLELMKTHTVKEIANIYGKSEKTISRHLRYFGLTRHTDRLDIKDGNVLSDWNAGMSIMDIARKYKCSHDTIKKRLVKYNIECDRKTGIERHFEYLHGQDWSAIKSDLDKCVPISIVAQLHNMRYEAVYRLMETNKYVYSGFVPINMVKLNSRINNAGADLEYLIAIRDYFCEFGNPPVVYTLSRRLDMDMKQLREICAKYDLFEFLGTDGPSVKVMRVINDLNKLGIPYELNNRTVLVEDGKQKEIDIYLPDYKLGIEVNPTWTHSVDTLPYGQSDKFYHQKKSLRAEMAGIGLIHLYDMDFIDESRYQVFLTQLKALTLSKIKIGARNCSIRSIDRDLSNSFLNLYHFQGGENSSFLQYGLFYNDMLVGVCTFGKSRYTSDEFEIIRYCMNPNYIVHGCFDKFLKHFVSTIGHSCDIVSYMDLNKRLVSTNVYEKHNFVFEKVTVPDYYWVKQSGMDFKSRYVTTKSKLVELGYDASKTEVEIMKSLFYCRVFGAGSKRYKYHYDI